MSDAKKARGSDKSSLPMQPKRYRVTNVPHFINGALREVGWVGQLPEGVKPGKYLEEVGDSAGQSKGRTDEKSAKDKEQEGTF